MGDYPDCSPVHICAGGAPNLSSWSATSSTVFPRLPQHSQKQHSLLS